MIRSSDVNELLIHLVDKSLVLSDDDDLRFGMLETVRQYASDALNETFSRERHFQFFRALSLNCNDLIRGPKQVEWLRRFDLEQDNFRAALSWGMDQPSYLLGTVEMAWDLLDYWTVRARFAEGLDWFTALLQRVTKAQAESYVLCLVGLACCCRYRDDPRDFELLREALALAEEAGNDRVIRLALFGIGYSHQYREQYLEGRDYLLRALPLQIAAGNMVAEGHTNLQLCYGYLHHGDPDEAEKYMLRAMEVRTAYGDVRGVGAANITKANILVRRGEIAEAAQFYAKGLLLLAETGDLHTFAECSGSGCCGLWVDGRYEEAAKVLGFSDYLQRNVGTKRQPIDIEFHREWIARVQDALGEDQFEAAYRQGADLKLDDVLALLKEYAPASLGELQ